MGFDGQEPLPDDLADIVPHGVRILLPADRSYGDPKLVRHCQEKIRQYCVRLMRNLTLLHQGGELSAEDLPGLHLPGIEGANLCGSGFLISIGVLHGELHGKPRFIALNGKPTPNGVLDCCMRWGIEALFSDWKTPGVSVFMTRLRSADRIGRLPTLISIACHYAVSAGLRPDRNKPKFICRKVRPLPCFTFQAWSAPDQNGICEL